MPNPEIELFIDNKQLSVQQQNPDKPAAGLRELVDLAPDVFASIGEKLGKLFGAIHPNQTVFAESIKADEFELEIGFSFEAGTTGPIKLIIDGKGGATCKAKVTWKRHDDVKKDEKG
jgi:hypothetical protein